MFKKSYKRLLSSLLAAVLALSFLPPGMARAAGAAEVSGTLAATLRLDYSQKLEELQERNVQVSLAGQLPGGRL